MRRLSNLTKLTKIQCGRVGFEPRDLNQGFEPSSSFFKCDLQGPPLSESLGVLLKMRIPGILLHPS